MGQAVIVMQDPDPRNPPLFLSGDTPPIWGPVAGAKVYPDPYSAIGDGMKVRDGLAGMPPCNGSSRIDVKDMDSGALYRAPCLTYLQL